MIAVLLLVNSGGISNQTVKRIKDAAAIWIKLIETT